MYADASTRTTAEREAHYLGWLERQQIEDTEQRRELWFRRYRKPEPPMSELTMAEILAGRNE